jgi:hypothetical protein
MIKSRRMRWRGHVTRMGGREVHAEFLWGNLKERGQLEVLDIDRSTILKCKLKYRMKECGLDLSGSRHGLVSGS